MEIKIDKTELTEILEKAEMKGRYYDGNKSKNASLANYAYCLVEEDVLFVYNADLTTGCGFRSEVETNDEGMNTFILDIIKTKAYLKPFTDEVTLTIGDYLTISDGFEVAKLPLVTEHPAHDMIRLISGRFNKLVDPVKQYVEDSDELPDLEFAVFGKTEYECGLSTTGKALTEAVKACDAVDLARYKIDINGTVDPKQATLSSERSISDSFTYELDDVEIFGEPATMEFTGDILKFVHGERLVQVHIKDDSPLILITPNSLLVKAPYLTR
jgi:hypothetical protein